MQKEKAKTKIRNVKLKQYEFSGYLVTDDLRPAVLEALGIDPNSVKDYTQDILITGEVEVSAQHRDDIQLDSIYDVFADYNGKSVALKEGVDYDGDKLAEDLSDSLYSSSFDYFMEDMIAKADFYERD